jgi:DNA invertase Pin-like site-specific DNA recombinase
VVVHIEETGSGARNDRPGLQRLMSAARRGKLDAVVVWRLDGFGRSALDVLANIRDLDAAGVRFIAMTQGIDIRPGGDAMSRPTLGILTSAAEFERDLICEHTRLGMAKARAAGKRIGRQRAAGPAAADVQRLRAAGRSWGRSPPNLAARHLRRGAPAPKRTIWKWRRRRAQAPYRARCRTA